MTDIETSRVFLEFARIIDRTLGRLKSSFLIVLVLLILVVLAGLVLSERSTIPSLGLVLIGVVAVVFAGLAFAYEILRMRVGHLEQIEELLKQIIRNERTERLVHPPAPKR